MNINTEVYIKDDKIEVEVEISFEVEDNSFSYAYGSINGVEKSETFEITHIEVGKATFTDDAGHEADLTTEDLEEVAEACLEYFQNLKRSKMNFQTNIV